jgi:putative ABC transport system substrate-binding protein
MIRGLLAFALATVVACFGPFDVFSPADAQQPAWPRNIGVLFAGSWTQEMVQALRQGLRDAGYVEGRDVVVERRHANGNNYDLLPQLATDPVHSKIDVIVVSDTLSARAAKRATSTISIVMVHVLSSRIHIEPR